MSGPDLGASREDGARAARSASPARRRWSAFPLAALGVACVALGLVLAIESGARPSATDAGALPDHPGAGASIAVHVPDMPPGGAAGTAPVVLELPADDITAPVVAVGTDAEGWLTVPDPPQTVGWWRGGAAAGDQVGAVVLVGHVDSATAGLGTLSVLHDAAVGDAVMVRGADGRRLDYRITARRSYPKQALPVEVFGVGGPARLVMITCGGRFDRATRSYADNVVVWADPVLS